MVNWTEKRLERLKKLFKEGFSASAIAKKLGPTFTKGAVAGQIRRLALTKKQLKRDHPAKGRPALVQAAPKRKAAQAVGPASKSGSQPAPKPKVAPAAAAAAKPVLTRTAPKPAPQAVAPAAKAGVAQAAAKQKTAQAIAPAPRPIRPIEVLPAAPVALTPAPPEPVAANGIRLYDLREGHCRWPLGVETPARFFCGAQTVGTSSWCEQHQRIAFGGTSRPSTALRKMR